MIRNYDMKHPYIPYRHAALAVLLLTAGSMSGKDYVVHVLNSAGDPQAGMILRIDRKEYTANEQGVIEFPYDGDGDTWIYLYFPTDKSYCVKTFSLEEADTQPVFRIDSPRDILAYKQKGTTFPIEGIVMDEQHRPLEGASVSVQGTGRKAVTDEAGLFHIEGDYAHPVVIRAPGMETRSVPIGKFLEKPDDTYTVYLFNKNARTVYSSAERMPEFPGGMKAFRTYLDRHLHYPEKAKAARKEGVVVIQFVVEQNGSITQAAVARRLEASMDTAALEVIEAMPDWIPARDNGRVIRCRYSVPVRFRLPKPQLVPAAPLPPLRPLGTDSVAADTTVLAVDSVMPPTEETPALSESDRPHVAAANSLQWKADTVSLAADSLQLQQDSTQTHLQPSAEKPRKGNLFARIARFFRRLFGRKNTN